MLDVVLRTRRIAEGGRSREPLLVALIAAPERLLGSLRGLVREILSPRLGASWKGFVIDQIIALVGADRDAFF